MTLTELLEADKDPLALLKLYILYLVYYLSRDFSQAVAINLFFFFLVIDTILWKSDESYGTFFTGKKTYIHAPTQNV